jgi:hypothetical protein
MRAAVEGSGVRVDRRGEFRERRYLPARDRKGVLHITNAPVDPAAKLDVRQPPPARAPTVVGNQP